MTTSLSSLLANALSQANHSALPLTSSQANSGATFISQEGATSATPSSLNNALSQAVTLNNAAKVIIERLPERVLAISMATSAAPSSVLQTLNTVLPEAVNATLNKLTTSNAQLAFLPYQRPSELRIPESKLTSAGSEVSYNRQTQSAVLLSTSTSVQNALISENDKVELVKALTQTLKENHSAVTLKGQLSISTTSETFGKLILTTPKNEKVLLSDINTEAVNSTATRVLKKLVGKSVSLSLSPAGSGNVSLRITQAPSQLHAHPDPESSKINVKESASSNATSFTQLKVSTNLQQKLIEIGLKQGGVAIEHSNSNQEKLNTFVNNVGAKPNTLKALSLLTLSGNNLSARTASQNALLQIHISEGKSGAALSPTSQSASLAIPTLTIEQTKKINLETLPTVTAKIVESDVAKSPNKAFFNSENIQGDAATSLKGSDVHKAISTLSRVLLSQTGSTNDALARLIAIVENKEASPKNVISTEPATQIASKIENQLKGLDALTAKPSKPSISKELFVGPPKPAPEHIGSLNKHVVTPPVTSNHSDLATTDAGLVKSNPMKPAIEFITKTFGARTQLSSKELLSSAFSNLIPQSSLSQSKLNTAAQPIVEPNTILGNNKPIQNHAHEQKVDLNTIAHDMNEQGLAQRVQQLVLSQALVTTPLNLTSPVSPSNFVQGLVALVQLALAGRAMHRQPSLKSQIDLPESLVSKTLVNMGIPAQPSRAIQELTQLDQRQQLRAQLKILLSNHQQNKVANVESRIQGQDSFYYIFPSLSHPQNPVELLIKREQNNKENKRLESGGKTLWNVTMKLDIGDSGQVLAKSKIDKNTLTIDLYASNDVVLKRIGDTLPYLQKRLTSLGLVVENTSYQRGNIPDSLKVRPHQIFETRV